MTRRPPATLMLLRHAMPDAVEEVAPRDWRLSDDGRAAARALRVLLPADALLLASDEPKALETVREASGGAAVLADPGFGEVNRPVEWVSDHRARARAYVEGTPHDGWEPRQDVAARFEAAVRRHTTTGRTLVIGTHGMAATVWLATRTTIDPGPYWEGLCFPDLIAVDLVAGTAARVSAAAPPHP